MLLAGCAPVAFRAPRHGGASARREGVTAPAAPAVAGGLLQPLGLRAALRRHTLSVAAPPRARRARRGHDTDALFGVCSCDARGAEVLCVLPCWPYRVSYGARLSQFSQAGAPLKVWVTQTDVVDAGFAAVKGVDASLTVYELIERWAAEEMPDVRPSRVTMRLVP